MTRGTTQRHAHAKRWIGCVLALLLVVAACGGDDDAASTTAGSDDAPATTAAGASGDGETLTVWTYYVSGGQVDALEAQTALFNETYPDVTVVHEQLPFDQLASRLLAGVATGDGPDVVFDNVVVEFPSLVSSGALLDVSSYWDGFDDADLFPESAVWRGQDDGIYNVMSYTNLLAMYYNADILAEYGIDPPTTVDELEAAMATVAEAGEYTPLAMSGVASPEGAWMFMPLLLSQGVDYCNFEGAAVEEAFATMESWSEQGFIPRETANWDQADAWQGFISGDFAFGWNGNWNLGDIDSASFELGTTRFPASGSEGSVVFPGGEGIGIGAFSENPDLAWEYVQTAWMSAEGGIINFERSGQIPTRSDLSDTPEVTANELVQPFVGAAMDTAAWPNNPQTAAMQNAVGQALSGVISGGLSAQDAAAQAIADVASELEAGGGSC